MKTTDEQQSHYDTGTDFWRDLTVSYDSEEATVIAVNYFAAQLRTENAEERQFCGELFTALVEDTMGRADPAKIVYPYSFAHAKEKDEAAFYHASRRQTEACANSIDSAIRECCYKPHFYNIEVAAQKVIAEFGFERVNTVLAHNFKSRPYEGRFSNANKDWASGIDLGERSVEGITLHAHPILLDGFTRCVREIYAELDADRFALPGQPEQGAMVDDYEIVRSIQFSDHHGFALGHDPESVAAFVVWQTSEEDGRRIFVPDQYFATEQEARDDFVTCVGSRLREMENPLAAVELSSEQNANMIDGLRNNLAYEKPDLTDGQTLEEIRELAPETLPAKEKPSLLEQLGKHKSDAPAHSPKERSGKNEPEL